MTNPTSYSFMDDSPALSHLVGRIEARLDSQDKVLGEIRAHTAQTNGRVTRLEQARIADEAVRAYRADTIEETKTSSDRRRSRREWAFGALIATASVVVSFLTAVVLG